MLVHEDPQKWLDASCLCSNRAPSTQDLPESLDYQFFRVMVVVYHLSSVQVFFCLLQPAWEFWYILLFQRILHSYA